MIRRLNRVSNAASIESVIKRCLTIKSSSTEIDNYEIDCSSLREIKKNFMGQNICIKSIFELIIQQSITSKNISVKRRSLFLLDYLFCRSAEFRHIASENIRSYYEESVQNSSSIRSYDERMLFTDQLYRLIELWDLKYGKEYCRLRALARYLRESLKVNN